MRLLEIIIPILIAIYLVWPFFSQSRPTALAFLPAVAVTAHMVIEKYRWQMIPLYVFAAILLIIGIFNLLHPAPAPRAALTLGALLLRLIPPLILLAVTVTLPILLPVPSVPAPDGPYKVGTATYVLTDDSRKELYSGKDEPRKFMIQVWYPATPAPGSTPALWLDGAEQVAPAIADYLNLPHFFLDHIALTHSSSYLNAPADRSGAPYPVLIFSHGWNGFRAQSTFLMQQLASHGYVVIGMEHPYGSRLTIFPDGSIAPNNPAALPPDSTPVDEYEKTARILVDQWASDMSYTLDTLTTWNQNAPDGIFTNLLDLQKVGGFGHSTGGGASIEFCGRDPRCKAGFPLDPFVRPVSESVLQNGLSKPFAFFFSQKWADDADSRNNQLFRSFRQHLPAGDAVMSITGTAHYDFSDLPALSPLAPQLKLKGPINGERVQKLVNTYVLAFFEQQFRAVPTNLFDGPSADFPEVNFLP
jgi:dienelactone hydrolase